MQPTLPRTGLVRGSVFSRLLEGLQKGHDLGGLVVGQADVGHGRAGLQRRRVENPLLEVVGAVDGDRATGDLGAAGDPGEVRANLAGGARDPGDRVAADTWLGGDDLRTFGGRAAWLEHSARRDSAELIGGAAGLAR